MFRSTSNFDRFLEKATSQLLLEPDWDAILQICDYIRQGDIQAKYAVNAIKRKIYAPNPHVALFALQVLESCVKNCGALVQDEIATKQFMEELRELIKVCNESVKNKILELIQTWVHAFRTEPKYRAVQDALNLMKLEGYTFPVLKESDAMFTADKAPEWAEGDCCHRCRVAFSVMQRKHHCRNCGQIFCNKCSSKYSSIPKFGIEKEVRVCEACHDKLNKSAAKPGESDLPAEYLASPLSQQPQYKAAYSGSDAISGEIQKVPSTKTEQELQEEEELQLALALSQSEAESKEKMHTPTSVNTTPKTVNTNPSAYSTVDSSAPSFEVSHDMDPELARYLNRSYWEKKQEERTTDQPSTTPSAPISTIPSILDKSGTIKISESYQNGEVDEMDEFLGALRISIEIFVNRMKSNSSRGRSIVNDSSVQSLFTSIMAMHSQLLKYLQEQDEHRVHHEGLQDKLAQLKDAREALDSLRDDHREKLRKEAEEQERLRQIQMAQKLEIMRQKKQVYLAYQREIAMQKMQEQERELQMRLHQQKQQYQFRNIPQPSLSYASYPGQSFGSPGGSVENSPVHTAYAPPAYLPPGSQQGFPSGMPPPHGPYGSQQHPVIGPQHGGPPPPQSGVYTQNPNIPSPPAPQGGPGLPPQGQGMMSQQGPGMMPPQNIISQQHSQQGIPPHPQGPPPSQEPPLQHLTHPHQHHSHTGMPEDQLISFD